MALDFIDSCAHSGTGVSAVSVATKWTTANDAFYDTTQVRTSGTSIAIVGSIFKSLTYTTERFLGVAFFFPISSSTAAVMGFTSGGVQVVTVKIETDLSLSLIAGNNVIWNSGVASGLYITGNVFHYYELHVTMGGGTPVTVVCDLHVDEAIWAAGVSGSCGFNASQLLCQASQMNQIFFEGANGGGDTSWVCDIYSLTPATTDINGHVTTLTTFLGDIAVNTVLAVTDVTTQMSNFGGSPPPVYPLIAEVPPDNDITYIYDNVVSHEDAFNFQPLIGFPGQILGAQLLIYARKDAEGTRTIQGIVGGTPQNSLYGSQDFLYDYYDYHIFPLDSDNGVPWTPSIYNVENFGVKLSA